MPSDVKEWLLAEVTHAEERLADAQADLDAACRMLARYETNQPTSSPGSAEDIRLAVITVLWSHHEPMHRQAIYDEIVEQGMYMNGKDPVANLGSILSRCGEDFYSHGNGIWGLKEWQPRPATVQPLVHMPTVNGNIESD